MLSKIKFSYWNFKLNFYEKLVLILPFSLILGNVAINLNIFLIILSFFFHIYFSEIKIIHFFKNKIFIFCLIFAIINILLSANIFFSVKAFLGLFKYYIFFIILVFFFKKEKNVYILSLIFFLTLNFLIIDTLIQFFYGKDIFGYEKLFETSGEIVRIRLSGPFGDELVIGGFLKNIFIISIFYSLNKNKSLFYIYAFITLTLIFLSGERSSSVMFLFLISIYFFFFNESAKKKIILFLILIISIISIFFFNQNLRSSTFERTFKQFGIIENKNAYQGHKSFFDSQWGAHYLTAYEIFQENKFIGSGAKTFRFICKDEKYKNINSVRVKERCATHPHNIYIEILSETGIIGLLIFAYLVMKTLFFQIKLILIKHQKNYNLHLSLLCIFIALIWPLQTTGSFFSTFNGFFYWFYLALIYSMQNYKS